MKLKYKDNLIQVTQTYNPLIMRYKYQKLYYAVIIYDCNRYSSIASKQRADVVLVDDDFNILSFERGMHENTVIENKDAEITILLPLDTFDDLELYTRFSLVD